ncbi:GNAT family N-acetyltransferase [Olivibacter sitiensis]|uniref:GNAT family N-acetyltransferase n=1 Tax=Olivibacter sitiensis TaxID=376470 RepID=UPI0004296825|nr:GNAT family N-acetyltransferase [Olivibacter sitiensis]
MKQYIIRTVQETDNPLLAKVIRQVFEEHDSPKCGTVYSDPTTDQLFQLFQQERSILWVAEMDDEVMGCCGIYPTDGLPDLMAELVKFYISRSARGHGVGKMLMEKSMQSAKDFGYKAIYIESLPQFSKAVSIYEKQGFVHLDAPLGNSGHSSCNIWMKKDL